MPNLVELGCSVGCPDELHRQLINLNQRLLEKLKVSEQFFRLEFEWNN